MPNEAKDETVQPEAIRNWPDVSVPSSLTCYGGRSLCPVFSKVWLVHPNNLRLWEEGWISGSHYPEVPYGRFKYNGKLHILHVFGPGSTA